MSRGALWAGLTATGLAFALLWAPQPLLPMLAAEFGVSTAQASLLISAVLLPLAVAPLVYGLILQRMPARPMLIAAIAVMAVTTLLLAFSTEWWHLVTLRFAQGLAIPAVMTAVMTLLAGGAEPARRSRVLALYIATTPVGGFAGRAFSGAVADYAGWREAFLALAVLMAACAAVLALLRVSAQVEFRRVRLRDLRGVLADPLCRRVYGASFLVFLVFSAYLNLLPFRLVDIGSGLSETGMGLMYTGYLIGAVVSFSAVAAAARLGGRRRAMALGFTVVALSLAVSPLPSVPVLFIAVFILCAGMFLVHALAPGIVNDRQEGVAGVANGVYIAAYYTGGVVGTSLPAVVYEAAGWNAVLGLLGVAAVAGAWLMVTAPGR